MATFIVTVADISNTSNGDSQEFEAENAVTAAFNAGVRAASNVVDGNFMISGYQICEILEDRTTVSVTEV